MKKYKIILLGLDDEKRKETISDIKSRIPLVKNLFNDDGISIHEFDWSTLEDDMVHLSDLAPVITISSDDGTVNDRYFWRGKECDLPF